MKLKTLTTVVLLAFVAASIAYLVKMEAGSREPPQSDPAALAGTTNAAGGAVTPVVGHRVVAYYFFGNVRCETCKKIEAYTARTIATFTNELSAGVLEWRTVNTDEKENEHFVDDYELTSRSVVLVRLEDCKQTEWKSLPDIWDLVGNQEAFQTYIAEETTAFLAKAAP